MCVGGRSLGGKDRFVQAGPVPRSRSQLCPGRSPSATGTASGSLDSLRTKSHPGKASAPEKFYLRMPFQSTVPVDADRISLLCLLKPSKF